MQHFVIDTSVISKAFTKGPESEKAALLLREVLKKKTPLHAPNLLRYEFFGVMVKSHKTKSKVEIAM